MDIVQNCEVTAIRRQGGRVVGVETSLGAIDAPKIAISVAGSSSRLAALAGLRLPVETYAVQAFVSEPVKPVLNTVVNFGAGMSYLSQTDKGEIVLGGEADSFPSHAQRGAFRSIEDTVARALCMFPFLGRLRLMRAWGGMADISMDGMGICGESPLAGLYLNAGWGYSGFKATPASGWTLAHCIANDAPHPVAAHLALARFESGAVVDESGVGPDPSLH